MSVFWKKLEKFFAIFANLLGILSVICLILLVCFVFYNVCARYFFHYGNVAFQELEWHFFAAMFMFGMAYALKEDAHVRVDVLYDGFKPQTKAIVNILGVIFFLLPFASLVAFISPEFVIEAFESGEGSSDPGGLAYRWIIKSLIPLCYVFLIISAFGFILQNLNALAELKRTGESKFLSAHGENSAKGV